MLGFKVSERMKLVSVWVVWAFVAIGALGWALFVVLEHFDIQERAGWAQAFGAVLAIGGAAAFPYLHEEHKSQARADRFRRVLLLLARNQAEQLRLLHSTLFNAVEDFGDQTINPYLGNGWHLKWPPHIEALRAIPIAELDPGQVHMLGELKVAASFAEAVIAILDDWNVLGDPERHMVSQLNHYHQMAVLTVGMLDRPLNAS